MKNVKRTAEYLFRAWWFVLPLVLIPSVASGLLSTPFWEVSFLTSADVFGMSAKKLFLCLFGDSWESAWPVLIISAVSVLFYSLAIAVVERHFRVGKLSLDHPFKSINTCIWPLAICFIIISLISILWRFVVFGVMALLNLICMESGATKAAAFSVMCIFALILFFVHVLIIMPMLFWAPIMIEYGYGLRDAASSSYRLLSGKFISTYLQFILPIIIFLPITMVLQWLELPRYVYMLVWSAFFILINSYAISYIMTTAFDLLELDRRDVKRRFGG